MKAAIKAISYYLPEQTLDNRQLCELFPSLNEQDIYTKTGIRKRHLTAPGEIASDLAYKSALKLFEEYGYKKENIDFLIFCSEGFDFIAPTSSSSLQHRLGLSKKIGAIDLPQGCSGYLYGLSISKAFIESGLAKNILFITADIPTKVLHPNDSELRILFGDAAAATLISSEEEGGEIQQFVFGTDGKGYQNLIVRSSAFREPITDEWLAKNKDAGGMRHGKMEMNGVEIFIFAIRVVPPLIAELLEKHHLKIEDIDLFIFHQANGFMLETLRKKIKIPEEKFFVYMENVGNTVSASIPIALKEAMEAGKAKAGSTILLAGFGIGYSWSGTIIKL